VGQGAPQQRRVGDGMAERAGEDPDYVGVGPRIGAIGHAAGTISQLEPWKSRPMMPRSEDAVADAFLQTCKSCNHEFRAHSKLVGKTVPCPYCQRPMSIVATAAQAEDKLVNQEIGGCRLARRLGAGALGVVYEAKQVSVGRKVAIKMLSSKAAADKEIVTRFQREANLCAKIRHPGVVGVYDCGQDRGVHFLTMEFIDGPSMAGLIEESGKLGWQEATDLIMQVARALEHLHGQGIIHRDIKPANILFDTAGKQAKLADLGLAKQVDADPSAGGGLTMQGIAMGSPAYMPPEQIRNARDANNVSDLYALGATYYQAVTGVIPFDGKNGTEVMTKVLREEPVPVKTRVPELPQGVADLITSMLSKDPAGRPQSAPDLIKALEEVQVNPEQPRSKKKSAGISGAFGAFGAGGGGVGKMGNIVLIAAVALIVVVGVVAYFVKHH
jgi:tRNA A-37 threonylcarbamoyl transferase component Bud32